MKKRKKRTQSTYLASDTTDRTGASRGVLFDNYTSALVAFVLLAVTVWAIYGRSLRAPFIFDDLTTVQENSSIKKLWPLLGDAMHPGPFSPSTNLSTSGRPLVNFTLAVNYHLGGLNPAGYRALNICLHVLSAWLLFLIVRRTLGLAYFDNKYKRVSGLLAFLVALLWALHPLQTEAVVYITQRTELMVGFFYLAALYASLRFWAANELAGRRTWFVLATLACLSGMASKEVMVTAPVMVLLFERTFIAGTFRNALQKSWPLYLGLATGWLLLIYLNYGAPRGNTAGFHLGSPSYVWWFTQAKVLLLYLKLVLWPWPLSIHYQMPYLETLHSAWLYLIPVGLAAAAGLFALWRNWPIGVVAAWVFGILAPTLVVPILTEVAAERRMYLPLAALMALVVIGGYSLLQRFAILRPAAIVGGAATVAALAWCSLNIQRLSAYEHPIVLWADAIRHQPDNVLALNNLGILLNKSGQHQEAIEQFQRVLRLKPDNWTAHFNLGSIYSAMGQTKEAVEHYQAALSFQPNNWGIRDDLGSALIHAGRYDEAVVHFEQSARLKTNNAAAQTNLGNALIQAGRLREAIEPFERALELQPNDWRAHNNLGIILARIGQPNQAIAHYEQALQLRPDYAKSHFNLGNALTMVGRLPEAIEQYQQMLQINPSDVQTHFNLANVYAKSNRRSEAIASAQRAIDLAQSQGKVEQAKEMEAWLTKYRTEAADSDADAEEPQTSPEPP